MRCAVAITLLVSLSCFSFSSATLTVPVPAKFPYQDYDKHNVITADAFVVDGVEVPIEYNPILRSGQKASNSDKFAFGQLVDQNMQPVYAVNSKGNPEIEMVGNQVVGNYTVSNNPDFSSLLPVGNKLYSVVHFEAPNPAASYLVELTQTGTCDLYPVSAKPIDWSAYGGLWTPCAGSVSPWGTHLGSEEYEPDARLFVGTNGTKVLTNAAIIGHMRYFGMYPNDTTFEEVQATLRPYNYGYPTEITVRADGSYTNVKHYAMGRAAVELPYVLPDRKTAFITDDGENVMFSMFKAAKENDLSCGNLFAARFNQTSAVNGGSFDITWLPMGYACDSDLRALANTTVFSDIFNATSGNTTAGTCPTGFRNVNTAQGFECLALKPGKELLASRFETRRYAAYIGATTEFSKWEGITFAADKGIYGRLYTSMSDVRNAMEDRNMLKGAPGTNTFDIGGPNHVRVPYNACGCVYSLDLNAAYEPTSMSGLICGNTKNNTDKYNQCDINAISSPDNIAYLASHDALLIGEDTSLHQNDVMWIYQFSDGSLARIQSTPFGAETTSAYWYPNVNNCAYIMSVVQHPYGESDQGQVTNPSSSGGAGTVGYLGPLPVARGGKGPAGAPARAPASGVAVASVGRK